MGALSGRLSPSFSGILTGTCKGRIFSDREDDPSLLAVYSYCVDGFEIVELKQDRTDAQLKRFANEILSVLASEGVEWFEYSSESLEICAKMQKLYPDRQVYSENEFSFVANGRCSGLVSVPDGILIRRMDADFLQELRSGEYRNDEPLWNSFDESWTDETAFLRSSAGYAAVCDRRLEGIVYGFSVCDRVVSVYIEVDKDRRRQHIAKRMSQELINTCMKLELTMRWEYTESNAAPRAAAASLGLAHVRTRPYYWFRIV